MPQAYLHDILAYLVVALCGWAILSPRVPTCIGGSAGLGLIAIAALLTLDDYSQPYVIPLLLGGTAMIGLQVLWMAYRNHRQPHTRRLSDWAPHMRRPEPLEELEEQHEQHVAGGRK